MSLIKQDLDAWLNSVDYSFLNSSDYVPTEFSLLFMNFVKLVNGSEGESHKTPPVHLKMLDKTISLNQYIANVCFRGAAKTTLFMEYLTLFLAFYGYLPEFGKVEGMIYVSDSMENGVKSARKNIEFRYYNSPFLIEWIPVVVFTDPYLEFQNKEGSRLGVKMFGAKTGLRGTKIFGKRPVLAVLDDLVSDDDAKSRVSMLAIKDTVYKGVNHALDPTRRKVILNGTPFGKEDILVEAVESGAWDVNVWPVCERFPVSREDFRGAWEDRFTYDYILDQYNMAIKTGKLAGFDQELMLRLTSEEDRLIQDEEIHWYPRTKLLSTKSMYNFYITTDFATSTKQTADYSVISVWAYNSLGHWFWVDGVAARQTIDMTWNDLFRLVQVYKPQQVGVEISASQQAYIKLLQMEMMTRNIWFNFAPGPSGELGIRPVEDKLSRLNMVVPWFKSGRMHFPEEMKSSIIMGRFLQQIRLATRNGLKGKDDCLDTISMLGFFNPWKPAEASYIGSDEEDLYFGETKEPESSRMSSYIV
jgi:phage terminase large subunit-like protein